MLFWNDSSIYNIKVLALPWKHDVEAGMNSTLHISFWSTRGTVVDIISVFLLLNTNCCSARAKQMARPSQPMPVVHREHKERDWRETATPPSSPEPEETHNCMLQASLSLKHQSHYVLLDHKSRAAILFLAWPPSSAVALLRDCFYPLWIMTFPCLPLHSL